LQPLFNIFLSFHARGFVLAGKKIIIQRSNNGFKGVSNGRVYIFSSGVSNNNIIVFLLPENGDRVNGVYVGPLLPRYPLNLGDTIFAGPVIP